MILKTEMLPHQVDAVNKLKHIKVGALYMEQGTGKTRTALELIALRYNTDKINHILWLCPCSVKRTIEKEIEKHLGNPDYITVCGIETLSSSIKTNRVLRELVNDKKVFLVVDESNLVKNHKALRTQRITYLAEHCEYRMILNGTPVSRDESDLFSQWYILDWRILGYRSFWSFANNHIEWDDKIPGKVKRTRNVDYLTRKIAPYTYQITKDECLNLPNKSYRTYYYDITAEQMEAYHYAADNLLFNIDEMLPHTIYRLFSGLQKVISGYSLTFDYDDRMIEHLIFNDPIDNPRIQTLLNVVDNLNDKAIIFCKYTHEIDSLIGVLNKEYGKNSALLFNGNVPQHTRQKNLEKFEKESRFLVANKVTAGYGLNLQFCNNIIFYSNDWDYATRAQAEDRVHRIGQNNQVNISDICAENTLDERILSNLNRKENLVDAFKYMIDKMKDKKDLKAIREWLDGKEKTDRLEHIKH